jgi:hypothetical protein
VLLSKQVELFLPHYHPQQATMCILVQMQFWQGVKCNFFSLLSCVIIIFPNLQSMKASVMANQGLPRIKGVHLNLILDARHKIMLDIPKNRVKQ